MDYKEYQENVKTANEASEAYYNNDAPIMSDFDFDTLMNKLKEFEKENPSLISPESPTLKVGGTAGKLFKKVEHITPMLSLRDVFSKSEVKDFIMPDMEYSVEEKIDGLSLTVIYNKGELVQAETRGDGYIGEIVTDNAKYINGIPLVLSSPLTLEVRFEVYMPIEAFEKANEELERQGKKLFANPRNAAAGILRTKKLDITLASTLKAFAFNIQSLNMIDEERPVTHTESLELLKELGFSVVQHRLCQGDEVIDEIDKIGERKNSLPYWIDGAVVKINSLSTRTSMGNTSKYPKWAVAYKYPPEEKETVIKDIILQTGRTGRVTPVAIFEPVFLAGTKVEKATLHNQNIIDKLGVGIGDTIIVRKAAEIIPEVVKVVKKCSDEVYKITAYNCPSCAKPLTLTSSGEVYCYNKECFAQVARKFTFWASKDCMDIQGLGDSQIAKFVDLGWLKDIPDIYRLKDHAEEMKEIEGMGEKAVEKLLKAIEESKSQSFDRVIKGLGIEGVGRHVGKALERHVSSLFSIAMMLPNELEAIEGIGKTTAETIYSAFHERDANGDQKMFKLISELQRLGVNTKANRKAEEKGVLDGKVFVVTGTLSTLSRNEVSNLIEKNGGKVSSSVSKKTDYLVCGESAGSKLTKAKALGIKILSENEFLSLLH